MRQGAIGAVLAIMLASTAPSARAGGLDDLFDLTPPQLPAVEPSIQAAQVRPLIARLGSDDYRTRETAGKAIHAMGDRAIPTLRQALKTIDDPEVARRVQVLARTLDAERLGTARKVTLKFVRRPVKAILAEIAQHTGYALQNDGVGGDEKALYSFDFHETPFWQALDKVCEAAGLTANQQDDDGTLTVSFTDTTNPHTAYSGPFKILATNINSGRSVQLSGLNRRQPNAKQPESLNLNLSVQAEPKAPIVGIGSVVLTKAIDDSGASLVPFEQEGNPSTSFYPPPVAAYKSFAQGFSIPLSRADRTSTSIKELRGKVSVALLSETRPELVIDDLLKVKKQRFTGRTVEVEVVSTDWQNATVTIEMIVRQRNADPEDYAWTNTVYQRLEVLDANGVKYQFGGLTNQNVGPAVISMTAQYLAPQNGRKIGPPVKLQYVEWITVIREVTFAFKDIPLP